MGRRAWRKEGMYEWGYWMQMINNVVALVTMCGGEEKRSWGDVRWTKMRKVKSTWEEKNVRKWSNSLLLLFVLCSKYSKTTCGLEEDVYPFNQYEEDHYRFRRMSHMKTLPLDVFLRYIPRVVYPPENFAKTDDSEVMVNEQSSFNHPPDSTTRSLSYPPPRPPQPLHKYFLHCSSLTFSYLSQSIAQSNCSASLSFICSAPHFHLSNWVLICWLLCFWNN